MKMLSILLLSLVAGGVQDRGAEDLLKDALASARDSKKSVLLTFGGEGCGWCVKFEAWKKKPEVAPLLDKEFVLLYIDMGKVPGGKELHGQYPNATGGIPWFVILDADRKALADSNGPKGNIGCPDTDEEIDYFMSVLKKVSRTLKDEDLAALKASLIAGQKRKS
jgi:uncharacterized protein YyaL (SSP411 family)